MYWEISVARGPTWQGTSCLIEVRHSLAYLRDVGSLVMR